MREVSGCGRKEVIEIEWGKSGEMKKVEETVVIEALKDNGRARSEVKEWVTAES